MSDLKGHLNVIADGNGVIQMRSCGADTLFGYSALEAVGRRGIIKDRWIGEPQ